MNGFDCQCAAGYVGDQCETNVDDCASNPCPNAIRCHVSSAIINDVVTASERD